MKTTATTLLALVALVWNAPLQADPWKDESGHGRGGDKWKQEYRVGNCKVERKWKRGDYKEEIKCNGAPWAWGYRTPPVIAYRAPIGPLATLPPPPPGPAYGHAHQDDHGRYCREYQTTGIVNGRQERLYGIACFQPDGSWAFSD